MKTQLFGIYDAGILANERLHFKAVFDMDLSYLAVFDTVYSGPNGVVAGHRSTHWFYPYSVKAGEHVVLYTRVGVPSIEARQDGSRYHFLFRGLTGPLYGAPGACAVLFEVQTWSATAPVLTALGALH